MGGEVFYYRIPPRKILHLFAKKYFLLYIFLNFLYNHDFIDKSDFLPMIPMTPRGLGQLQKELQSLLTVDRPAVIEDIARARQYGDLSENAEYHAAREKQRTIEDRIRQLEHKINNASVIDVSTLTGPKIVFGAVVSLYDEDKMESLTYQIVGMDEADLAQKKIAIDSALARELIGKEEGASIELATPRGEKHYFIEKVEYRSNFGVENLAG